MRIISGRYKGKTIVAPSNLPVRPTTDFAKTGLFNILNNELDFEKCRLLDLFAGTGNISYEFFSRGCNDVTCVDADMHCTRFIMHTLEKLGCYNSDVIKSDALKYLQMCRDKYDVIFADPPYDYKLYEKIPHHVFENELLNANGLLILEHASDRKIEFENHFRETRKYGHVAFTFYQAE